VTRIVTNSDNLHLVISAAGTVIENNRTLPYGEPWLPEVSSTNDKKFTSYQRDQESGLDYAMGRYYANTAGRFASVDPGPLVLFRQNTLNRYAYTSDDPLNKMDSNGLQEENDPTPPPLSPSDVLLMATRLRRSNGLRALQAERDELRFQTKVGQVKKQVAEKLGNADEDCQELLGFIGTDATTIASHLQGMSIENGTIALDRASDLLGYVMNGTSERLTVADLFKYGAPPYPNLPNRIDGFSPRGRIFVRPDRTTWQLLVHETLHQFGDGFDDEAMMVRMQAGYIRAGDKNGGGIDPKGASNQITAKIREKCN
jgi:RHS repeat-associated protein